MKCLVISENERCILGFRAMGLDSVLAESDDNALLTVKEAIESRKVGTLILSRHVNEISNGILESHRQSGRLPYVMVLKEA